METIAIRLRPGQDLFNEMEQIIIENNIAAACILTCVGSLTTATIRYANQEKHTTMNGHFEIVSLTGAMSTNGSHYHISISDGEGKTLGGHLLPGCKIYTTAEIVIGVLKEHTFLRTDDPETGYPELEIILNP